MREFIKTLLGIKGIKAWAIISKDSNDDFLLIQNRSDMNNEIYVDSTGKVKHCSNLNIVPCTIII